MTLPIHFCVKRSVELLCFGTSLERIATLIFTATVDKVKGDTSLYLTQAYEDMRLNMQGLTSVPYPLSKAGRTHEVKASINITRLRYKCWRSFPQLSPVWVCLSDLQTHLSKSMQFRTSASPFSGYCKFVMDLRTILWPWHVPLQSVWHVESVCHQGFGHQLTLFSSSAFNRTHLKKSKNVYLQRSLWAVWLYSANSHSDILLNPKSFLYGLPVFESC